MIDSELMWLKIHTAGVCHFDPLGRERLIYYLRKIRDKYSFQPEFIAVEWDSSAFATVKAQRNKLRDLLKQHWPATDAMILDELSLTLGFEGDAHADIFPSTRVLWLDEGRQGQPPPADVRIMTYKSYLSAIGLENINNLQYEILEKVSEEAWQRSRDDDDYSRDKKFAERIQEKSTGKDGYGIAVVGALHASNNPNRMRHILGTVGLTCDVEVLRP